MPCAIDGEKRKTMYVVLAKLPESPESSLWMIPLALTLFFMLFMRTRTKIEALKAAGREVPPEVTHERLTYGLLAVAVLLPILKFIVFSAHPPHIVIETINFAIGSVLPMAIGFPLGRMIKLR